MLDSTDHSLLTSDGFRCAFEISMYMRFGDLASPCLKRTSPLRSTITRSDFSEGQYRTLLTVTFSTAFKSVRGVAFDSFDGLDSFTTSAVFTSLVSIFESTLESTL